VQERESILRGLAQNESLRLIAERIGRSPSTSILPRADVVAASGWLPDMSLAVSGRAVA
jgi:hypothetical protein